MKPPFGTAETRHTSSSPKRTVALPPADSTVCTPEPSSRQSAGPPLGLGPAVAGGVLLVGCGAGVRGVSERVGFDGGDEDGEARVGLGSGVRLGVRGRLVEEAKTVGASRATSGVGLVEPTTKCTVRMTAVTLTEVQESQMST
ncbi:hypothetical protein CRI70_03530 [Streptomyces sp. Ru87]|uniref:Uncharacterized protein n=1 Tax=Streptomyces lycii TaxID=2654337 RepID=A0ABQ7FMA7_9ACTN|nr:hypothetical protein GCU69_06995 [Streptomyces lycii]PGH52034.1 hypothetical protein CRI70_03530 [Streptomyces sp. Ru87]